MGTITAQAIADKAWTVLQDTNGAQGVRWPAPEVLGWVNDAQREVVLVLPSAYTKSDIAAVVAGTRQTSTTLGLATCMQILKVTRNFAADGTTVGRAITKIPMAVLDQEYPNWHSATGTDVIHYSTDPQETKAVYLWPAVTAGKKVEVMYSASPADVATINAAITIDDIYSNAMQYYVLFRSLSKRASNLTGSKQEAVAYYNMFLQSLGIKEKVQLAADAAQQNAAAAA